MSYLVGQCVTDAAAGAVGADEQVVGQLLRIPTGRTQPQPPGWQVELLIPRQTRQSSPCTHVTSRG